jgi:hypothetical protein
MSPTVSNKLRELERAGLLSPATISQYLAGLEARISPDRWSEPLSRDLDQLLIIRELLASEAKATA